MPDPQFPDISEKIWEFLRGDLPTTEFEQWVYDTSELRSLFSPDVYLELISVDYRDKLAVNHIKDTLRDWVEGFPRSCECITWQNDEQIAVGYDTAHLLKGFETLKKRTPWLDLIRCLQCGTYWYVAVDTVDDWYYLHRLKHEETQKIVVHDEWPDCFDNKKHVWPSDKWLKKSGYKNLEEWRSKEGGITND